MTVRYSHTFEHRSLGDNTHSPLMTQIFIFVLSFMWKKLTSLIGETIIIRLNFLFSHVFYGIEDSHHICCFNLPCKPICARNRMCNLTTSLTYLDMDPQIYANHVF
jgi:hypothetical protein